MQQKWSNTGWQFYGSFPCIQRRSSFEISSLFAGHSKVHFEPEIASLSHALKSSFLSALSQ
jgi:hypothetical protein